MSDISIGTKHKNYIHNISAPPLPTMRKELDGRDLLKFITNGSYKENVYTHIVPESRYKNTDGYYTVIINHDYKQYKLNIRMDDNGLIIIKKTDNSIGIIKSEIHNKFPLKPNNYNFFPGDESFVIDLFTEVILNKFTSENNTIPSYALFNSQEKAHLLNYNMYFIKNKFIKEGENGKQILCHAIDFSNKIILTGCQPEQKSTSCKDLFLPENLQQDFLRIRTDNTIVSFNNLNISEVLLQEIVNNLSSTKSNSVVDIDNAIFMALHKFNLALPTDIQNNLHLISIANSQAMAGKSHEIFSICTHIVPEIKYNTKTIIDIKTNDNDFLIRTKYDIHITKPICKININGSDLTFNRVILWNIAQGNLSSPTPFIRWDSGFSTICE